MPDPAIFRSMLQGGWRDLPFEHFREGIEVHWLSRADPQVALLRYAPGASAPRHRHPGLETILVLDGAQSDAFGTYRAGDMVMNPPGSAHEVWSETGCAVLLHWDKPVEFLP